MHEFSRSQWAQIQKRARQAQYVFDAAWKCLLCGKKFRGSQCAHTHDENRRAAELAKAEN